MNERHMSQRYAIGRWIVLAPLALLGILLFTFIGGEVVKLLWNWLLPPLFGLSRITFWQALGILLLCRILFGGFRGYGSRRSHFRQRMAERWERMTPEQRERFRHGIFGRCGFGEATDVKPEDERPHQPADADGRA